MQNPTDYRYSREHEWVHRQSDGTVRVGISHYAQRELGSVVYVELPEVGWSGDVGSEFGTVESVKAVSEIYAPVGGTVTAVNGNLEASPELVNEDPYGEGWIAAIKPDDPAQLDELMTATQYEAYLAADD